MNSKAKCLSALNNLVFVALIISLSFSFVQQAGAQIPEGSDTDAGAETFAVHCYNGVAYPWAGSVWNRSSRDIKIYGNIHLGNKQGELTLGPGEDSRDTDMCDVDKVKHDISPPSEWRYYLVDKNVGDWAKVSALRPICSDPPSNESNRYGVKCG